MSEVYRFLRLTLLGAVIISASVFLWFTSLILPSNEYADRSPARWFTALVIPLIMAYRGLKKKSVRLSGAILGYFVGFVLTLSNYCFLASLMTFFVSSSWATKFRGYQKKLLEDDYKQGGQRNWEQVLCNGGVATYLALLYYVEGGSGEVAIDYRADRMRSWLSVALLGALGCCNGDTWASELAPVLTSEEPRLITEPQRTVPRGTNGGVTVAGLALSAAGGLVVGLAFYLSLLLRLDARRLYEANSQFAVVPAAALAGLIGSLIDSVLGALFQFSGLEEKTGRVVGQPGPGVVHISGRAVLDNHSVNFVSSLLTALLLPEITKSFF